MRDIQPAQDLTMVKIAGCSATSTSTSFIGVATAQDWLVLLSIAVQVVALIYGTVKLYDFLRHRGKGGRHED